MSDWRKMKKLESIKIPFTLELILDIRFRHLVIIKNEVKRVFYSEPAYYKRIAKLLNFLAIKKGISPLMFDHNSLFDKYVTVDEDNIEFTGAYIDEDCAYEDCYYNVPCVFHLDDYVKDNFGDNAIEETIAIIKVEKLDVFTDFGSQDINATTKISEITLHISDIIWADCKEDFESEINYQSVADKLPTSVDIPISELYDDGIANYLSNKYGYRIYNFCTEEIA